MKGEIVCVPSFALVVAIAAALQAATAAGASAQTVPAASTAAHACVAVSPAAGGKRCIVPGSGRVEWFRDCEGCPEMVVLPRGSMPAPTAQSGPSRPADPFAIGRFAVTFEQWDACVDAGGCNGYRPGDEGWGRANRPVVNVSWEDAGAYASWLSGRTRKRYRLPSGAEREYAARAATVTRYWWGDAIDPERANIDLPVPARRQPGADYGALEKVRHRTVPVDSFAANPWGLYNVHGNVWEWTRDCAEPPVASAARDRRAGVSGGKRCGTREARGGSWLDFAAEAASAARIGFAADSRNRAQGFRLVRSLP